MTNFESHFAVAAIIWLSAVAGFLASYIFAKNQRVLALGNTFGGGVLLAAGLVHLTNDSFESFEEAGDGSWSKRYDYPWAAFFVCLGFLVTLVIEVSVLQILDDTRNAYGSKDGTPQSAKKASSLYEAMLDSALENHDKCLSDVKVCEHNHSVGAVLQGGFISAIVFLCAISCHSFIAGLGIGALTGTELWSGMIAIIAHKSLATFTLANCFMNANVSKSMLISFMFGFSLVTPVGILCGMLISNLEGPMKGVLIGLAGGSFLYIGIIEVISKEVENPRDWKLKLLMLIFGWGLMSLLALWV